MVCITVHCWEHASEAMRRGQLTAATFSLDPSLLPSPVPSGRQKNTQVRTLAFLQCESCSSIIMSPHVPVSIVSDVSGQPASLPLDILNATESFPGAVEQTHDNADGQEHGVAVAFWRCNGRCKRDITHDQLLFWKAMMELAPVRNPSLIWHERRRAFLRTYFSQCVIASHQTYNYILHERAPSNTALHAARDALGLIHLGSHSNGDQFLYEGRRRHVAALRCMSEQIISPKAVQNDGLLAASYALGQCEASQSPF